MTPAQASKLKLYLEKTADYDLSATDPINQTATHGVNMGWLNSAMPALEHLTSPITSSLSNIGHNILPSLIKPIAKSWNNVTGILPTLKGLGAAAVPTAVAATKGLGYGALSTTLPMAEKSIEKSLNYTPSDDSALSRAYDGTQDVSPLYLDQSPSQKNPSTRTWGNWVDQSMTSGGGLKNTVNNGVAGSVWGLPGAVISTASTIPADLYSIGKGMYKTWDTNHQSQLQQDTAQKNYNNINDRQQYQFDHGIPMHNPTSQEFASYHLNKQSGFNKEALLQLLNNKLPLTPSNQ